MVKIVYLIWMGLFLISCNLRKSEKDNEKNIYDTVKIGTQVWMKNNLDVSIYRNGDSIRHAETDKEWKAACDQEVGAWCYFNNDSTKRINFGKLYNWYAVNDSRGLAPKGWHISTDAEWNTLVSYLNGDSVAGGKLKSIGTIDGGDGLWRSPNSDATDLCGFSACPGGRRTDDGLFFYLCSKGYWWTSKEDSSGLAWSRNLIYGNSEILIGILNKGNGFSVRCVKD